MIYRGPTTVFDCPGTGVYMLLNDTGIWCGVRISHGWFRVRRRSAVRHLMFTIQASTAGSIYILNGNWRRYTAFQSHGLALHITSPNYIASSTFGAWSGATYMELLLAQRSHALVRFTMRVKYAITPFRQVLWDLRWLYWPMKWSSYWIDTINFLGDVRKMTSWRQ